MINTQDERERAESPARRGLLQQPILPRPPARQQFGIHLPGQERRELAALLGDGTLHLFDGGQAFVEAPSQALERFGQQVQKVRPANPRGRRAGQLPPQEIDQPGKLAARLKVLFCVLKRGQRVDQEDMSDLPTRREGEAPAEPLGWWAFSAILTARQELHAPGIVQGR